MGPDAELESGEEGKKALTFVRMTDAEKFVFLYTELRWIGKTMMKILEGQERFKNLLIGTAIGVTVAIVGAVLSYHIWPR